MSAGQKIIKCILCGGKAGDQPSLQAPSENKVNPDMGSSPPGSHSNMWVLLMVWSSGPLPFWQQRLVSRRTISPLTRIEQGWLGMIQEHYIYCALYFYYFINSISGHQGIRSQKLGTPNLNIPGQLPATWMDLEIEWSFRQRWRNIVYPLYVDSKKKWYKWTYKTYKETYKTERDSQT